MIHVYEFHSNQISISDITDLYEAFKIAIEKAEKEERVIIYLYFIPDYERDPELYNYFISETLKTINQIAEKYKKQIKDNMLEFRLKLLEDPCIYIINKYLSWEV